MIVVRCRYITAQKMYMLDTHEELHKRFMELFPATKLSQSKFEELAPW